MFTFDDFAEDAACEGGHGCLLMFRYEIIICILDVYRDVDERFNDTITVAVESNTVRGNFMCRAMRSAGERCLWVS